MKEKPSVPAPHPPLRTGPARVGAACRRLLVVEDHPIVRNALGDLIQAEPDLQVCGMATDAQGALERLQTVRADLILLDLSLGGGCEGLELLKAIKREVPGQRVLVVSMHDEPLYASAALREGASGYVIKQEPTEQLLYAIRQVLDGGTYLSEPLAKGLIRSRPGASSPPVLNPTEVLTERERQVFRLVGEGRSARGIAQQLGISPKTVEGYRAQIKAKLQVGSVTALVRVAMKFQEDHGND